jgi:hypothetical protein
LEAVVDAVTTGLEGEYSWDFTFASLFPKAFASEEERAKNWTAAARLPVILKSILVNLHG